MHLFHRYELRLESRSDALARTKLRETQADGNEVCRRVRSMFSSFVEIGALRQEITMRAQKVIAALTVRLSSSDADYAAAHSCPCRCTTKTTKGFSSHAPPWLSWLTDTVAKLKVPARTCFRPRMFGRVWNCMATARAHVRVRLSVAIAIPCGQQRAARAMHVRARRRRHGS